MLSVLLSFVYLTLFINNNRYFMVFLALSNIYLFAIGRASMIGGAALLVCLIVTPMLHMGGEWE